jgi:hypothetical protein
MTKIVQGNINLNGLWGTQTARSDICPKSQKLEQRLRSGEIDSNYFCLNMRRPCGAAVIV